MNPLGLSNSYVLVHSVHWQAEVLPACLEESVSSCAFISVDSSLLCFAK